MNQQRYRLQHGYGYRWILGTLLFLALLLPFVAKPVPVHAQEPTTTQTTDAWTPNTCRLVVSTRWVRRGDTVMFLADSAVCPATTGLAITIGTASFPLYDDGINGGDFAAGDGIYTFITPLDGLPNSDNLTVSLSTGDQQLLDNQELSFFEQDATPYLLLLTDWRALYTEFRNTGMDVRENRQSTNTAHDFVEVVERIERYTATYSGTVVDLPYAITPERGYPRTDTSKTSGCIGDYKTIPYGTGGINGLQQRYCKGKLIDELIDDYTKKEDTTTQYTVLLGDDAVVPSFRIQDFLDFYNDVLTTGNSPERKYKPLGSNYAHPILQDMNAGYILSDVPYSTYTAEPGEPLPFKHVWDKDTLALPQPDMGIGRIFAPLPHELLQAIERYEQPLAIDKGNTNGKAYLFLGEDDVTQPEPVLYPQMFDLVAQSQLPFLRRWFQQDKIAIYDPYLETWYRRSLEEALTTGQLVSWTGASEHTYLHVEEHRDIWGQDLANLPSSPTPTLVVGLASHMGLHMSYYPYDKEKPQISDYQESLVTTLVSRGITLFAPTTYAYIYAHQSTQSSGDATLHERMVSYFINHATDYRIPTVGQLWKETLITYKNIDDPSTATNPNANLFFHTVAYGMALYGLPTQPLRDPLCLTTTAAALSSSATTTQAIAQPTISEASQQKTLDYPTTPVTRTLYIPLPMEFTQQELPNGTTLFGVEQGLTYAPPNMEIVPMMHIQRTLAKDVTLDDIAVRVMPSDTETLSGTYTLPRTQVQIVGGRLITSTHQLPPVYLEQVYTYDLIPQADSTLLVVNVYPLRYRHETGEVMLIHHVDVEIDVPDYLSLATDGGSITGSIAFDNTDDLRITPPTGFSGNAILAWTLKDQMGNVVDSHREPIVIPQNTEQYTYSMATHTARWQAISAHISSYNLDVHLTSCQSLLPDGAGEELISGKIYQITSRQGYVEDTEPFADFKYFGDTDTVEWNVRVKETTINKTQLRVFIDGVKQNATINGPAEDGTYTITLTLDKTLPRGVHPIRVDLLDDNDNEVSSLTRELRWYNQGLRVTAETYKSRYTGNMTTYNSLFAYWKVTVENEQDYVDIDVNQITVTVNSVIKSTDEVTIVKLAETGNYSVSLKLTPDMEARDDEDKKKVWVGIHAKDTRGEIGSDYSDIRVEAIDPCRYDRSQCPNILPRCFPYSYHDVVVRPGDLTRLSIDSVCYKNPFSDTVDQRIDGNCMVCQTDPFSVTVDQKNNGDWYVLPTLINKRLEVSMTNILLGANYDITLYTRTITDFIYVAHSTYQLNSDETFTYTFTEQMSNPYYFLRVDFKDVRTDQDDRYRLSMRTLPLQDTALSRNTSTYLPHVFNIKSCNGISFSDIPYAQQHLVYINTVCQSQPSATPDDINDWYHIYLNEGQPVTIDVTDMSVGADYDLFLYRLESNGTVALQSPLASSQNKSQESEQVSYIAEATGAYYIQVFLAEKVPHNMQSTYNLLVSTFVK